jgi:uncharacterized protein YqgC (DUF456 family)
MTSTLVLGIAVLLMVPGIAMAFIPMLPALSYMFLVALLFGIYDKFTHVSSTEMLILLGIVLVSIVIDQGAGVLGAKYGGAHTKSLLWGMLGGFIGTILFPVLGSFIGLFIAVLGAELYYKKSQGLAMKAAGSALIGSITGVVVNIILACTFIGLFIYFVGV